MNEMTRQDEINAAVAAFPAAWWPWRLPVVRHLRAGVATYRINRRFDMWTAFGQRPVNADIDYAIRDAIRRGEK